MKFIDNYRESIKKDYSTIFKERARYFKEVYDSFSIQPIKKEEYLDIGCGLGFNTEEFSKGFKEIYALEYNTKDLEKAKKNITIRGVKFFQGDAQNLKFKSEFFDFITLISVIEHIPNTKKEIKELKRVMKKEGVLAIQLPNKYFFVELHTYLPLLYLLPEKIRNKLIKKLGYSDDARYALRLSKTKLVKILEKEGFEVNCKKMIYPEEIIPKNFKYPYLILKKLGAFNLVPFGYFIVCRKR